MSVFNSQSESELKANCASESAEFPGERPPASLALPPSLPLPSSLSLGGGVFANLRRRAKRRLFESSSSDPATEQNFCASKCGSALCLEIKKLSSRIFTSTAFSEASQQRLQILLCYLDTTFFFFYRTSTVQVLQCSLIPMEYVLLLERHSSKCLSRTWGGCHKFHSGTNTNNKIIYQNHILHILV